MLIVHSFGAEMFTGILNTLKMYPVIVLAITGIPFVVLAFVVCGACLTLYHIDLVC